MSGYTSKKQQSEDEIKESRPCQGELVNWGRVNFNAERTNMTLEPKLIWPNCIRELGDFCGDVSAAHRVHFQEG